MKTIIAGTDFSQSSYNAARYAATLARKSGCKLVLFNMFDVPLIHSNSGLYFVSYTSIKETSIGKLERFSKRLKKEFPGVEIDHFATAGSFTNELKNFTRGHSVEYVVMGLATKNKFSKFLYGSHSTDVVGKVSAPVIIVPEQYKEHKIKKVVLGVDNKEKLHKSPLKRFENFLKEMKEELKVLHVRTEEEIFDLDKKMSLALNRKKYPVEMLNESSLEKGMKKFTRENNVDLVTIISRQHSAFYNLFNETNTKQIAFASRVPVMAIHE